jgi:hypothetical protein
MLNSDRFSAVYGFNSDCFKADDSLLPEKAFEWLIRCLLACEPTN